MRFGIVAGEASGDILGAGLIAALRQRYPDARFEGIGGPRMIAAGMSSWYAMDRLSVMGLIEPLKRLPELLRMRTDIINRFRDTPPDVFIGIDSPDFNLTIERKLHEAGIKTCHYVSPSVWAWRQKRIFKIKKSVDLMLTLLPFEAAFYEQHQVPVAFVGHPLADTFPLQPSNEEAREQLGLEPARQYVALMPGSRGGEVALLGRVFLQVAQRIHQQRPDLGFLIPAANQQRYDQLQQQMRELGIDSGLVDLRLGQSHAIMAASCFVLMASGTTTLEAMLLKKPMVVAYRMAPLSYTIISRLLKTRFVSLPNLLADEALVPELLQAEATPEKLAEAVLAGLRDRVWQKDLERRFLTLHHQLKQDASHRAADAIARVVSA